MYRLTENNKKVNLLAVCFVDVLTRKRLTAVAALALTVLVLVLAVQKPELAELPLMIGQVVGIQVIPPTGVIPDLGQMAAQNGLMGQIGQPLLAFAGTIAFLKGAERVWGNFNP
ncbi:hypothetical protein [Haloferax profundi]|uniref:hypothetical protein n=1 Tax=Haloferax profundi TaxID=1544718 RepID=UPI000AA18AFB|nr:hypothetical protein [Haloferax profundi]